MRSPWVEYFDILELPIGEVPYVGIAKALEEEKYLRKFSPTFPRNDFLHGHLAALLYWYPHYINDLYEYALKGANFRDYFNGTEMADHFVHLFPQVTIRLDRLRTKGLKTNHLDEIKL